MKNLRLMLGWVAALALVAAMTWKFWPAAPALITTSPAVKPTSAPAQVALPAAPPATAQSVSVIPVAQSITMAELFARQKTAHAQQLQDLQNELVETQRELQTEQGITDASPQSQHEELLRTLENAQTNLQTRINLLAGPLPPPTDLGEIELTEGVRYPITVQSVYHANLIALSQPDGNILVTLSLGGDRMQTATSAVIPGQPAAIVAGNYVVGFVLKLKGGVRAAQNSAAPSTP